MVGCQRGHPWGLCRCSRQPECKVPCVVSTAGWFGGNAPLCPAAARHAVSNVAAATTNEMPGHRGGVIVAVHRGGVPLSLKDSAAMPSAKSSHAAMLPPAAEVRCGCWGRQVRAKGLWQLSMFSWNPLCCGSSHVDLGGLLLAGATAADPPFMLGLEQDTHFQHREEATLHLLFLVSAGVLAIRVFFVRYAAPGRPYMAGRLQTHSRGARVLQNVDQSLCNIVRVC